MLETIYEVDENPLEDKYNDDDPSKISNQPSRLAYYICLTMITVCFLIFTLVIAISLNPLLLSNQPIQKTSKLTQINFDDISTLSSSIIKHLNIFSHQINEQLNLHPNTITFLTSIISNISLENSDSILWLYSHLKYPQLCIDNIKCKEYFHLKLKKSFTILSNLFKNISHQKQIQLDWCNLIKNSTTVVSISLLSIKPMNQSEITDNHIICENINENTFLLETFKKAIEDNNQNQYPSETNLTCINSSDCLQINNNDQQMDRTIHSPNDYPPMWNSF